MKKASIQGELIFRILREGDSIAEVNALLLSTYRPLKRILKMEYN
jgi:hypothetical protein